MADWYRRNNLRGDLYDRLFGRLGTSLAGSVSSPKRGSSRELSNRTGKEYPNIRDYIAFAEVGTAKTMQRYLRTPNGTAYGFDPGSEQFFRLLKVKFDKLNNLYFVGA
ncbi:MAG: hypothetical protein IE889_04940 [Campylobacterales bacterium]|nr:hypothetical protein [Campylobacterales bacterium]